MKTLYADVIVDISHENVDRPFQYRIPERMKDDVAPGVCVKAPFGRGDALKEGYVIGVSDRLQIAEERVKEIAEIVRTKRSADATLIRLAAWMRARYGGAMIQSLKTVLPARQKTKSLQKKYVDLLATSDAAAEYLALCKQKKHVARARLMEALMEAPDRRLPYPLITGKLHVSAQTVRALEETGLLRVVAKDAYRDPAGESVRRAAGAGALEQKTLTLSAEQEAIVRAVGRDVSDGVFTTYLLHGVTGSGKTEVYIRLIEETVKRGKQAIVLIPEIALTYQTLIRFYRHFGDRVSVMNSTLSAGEKYDQFRRAREGKIDVMIGPRSALFTPFLNLGLIVIDEEHETTYKSETTPKYHARETAIALASFSDGASVVLGSATPSLEAYAAAKAGDYKLFTLTRRLTGGALAKTQIVDLRQEMMRGNRSAFSIVLQEMMRARLGNGEQTMLFLNRRGYAGFVSCRACGHVFRCPHCDVSLSEHVGGRLVCHYCGFETARPGLCPVCGSQYVSSFKAGTQQIERAVKKLLPSARVLRMDADTTRSKHGYEEILSAFANREADILVGTQMIVKGHDFPNVTLVGVLAADLSLHVSDFRAAERTYQLLAQAAGRAGRGTKAGDVVVQTYQPEHYAVIAGARQDYPAFFEEEYAYRALLQYPPASHMLAAQTFSKDEDEARNAAKALRGIMEQAAKAEKSDAIFIGPAPATISRVDDVYRFVVYVKHKDANALKRLREAAEEATIRAAAQIQYDMDPVRGF